jgi:hypothetical protein
MRAPDTLARASDAAFHAADATTNPETKDELLHQAQALAAHSALADAYSYLQKAVGLIAVTLPFVVAIGNPLTGGHGMEGSISAYYYTHMGNYFVGALFALGVFFLSYSYRPLPNYQLDNYLSNIAAAMAIGVALLPTSSAVEKASGGAKTVAVLHLVCAGVLFVLLAVFSLFLFTKTDDPAHITVGKRRRNVVYRICGVIIVASLVAVVGAEIAKWHVLFWLESIMVVAFGISWLVKGGFLGVLADP